ncbi:hypothetical protein [Thalassiella azotivora]
MTTTRRLAAATAAVLAAAVLAACTDAPDTGGGDRAAGPTDGATTSAATLAQPEGAAVVPGADAASLAAATVAALYERSPVAVLAPVGDVEAQLRAGSVAVAVGAPLLLGAPADDSGPTGTGTGTAAPTPAPADGEVAAHLDRLGTDTVVVVGDVAPPPDVRAVPAPEDDAALGDLVDSEWASLPEADAPVVAAAAATMAVAGLDPAEPALLAPHPGEPPATGRDADGLDVPDRPDPLDDVAVLTTGTPDHLAAVATARAAGAAVHVVPDGDPRSSAPLVTAFAGSPPSAVLALGAAFGTQEVLDRRLGVVRTGVQLPGGGQTLFPGRRLVALYGHPGTPSLGVLGEQPLEQAVVRAKDTAAPYDALSDRPVVPAFEIIATVASAGPGADGNYSNEVPAEELAPWVDAAGEAGVYVLLDLQPGRTDFLTQARLYEDLLRRPHVGLALDPEWRLAPGERHMQQIGSVDDAEVNAVVTWLAELTREAQLPQKLLVLHQFRLSMLPGREQVVTGLDEVQVLVHADGNGNPGQKLATWRAVLAGASPELAWGWKNFYDEDSPTFTPEQTFDLTPVPDLVTYQ